jgi:hypothetical protein
MAKHTHSSGNPPKPPGNTPDNAPLPTGDMPVGSPQFGEVQPDGSDPASNKIKHGSDTALYNKLNKHLLQPIPAPLRPDDLVLTLEKVYGAGGAAKVAEIQKNQQIVFHSGGDTGPTKGPQTVEQVADKITNDFSNETATEIPSFFFHLGDIVYSFGEAMYYYDQFYEPFRNYPAPILSIPGNHDGLVYTGDAAPSLDAFLRNFVNTDFVITPEAGGLRRTAMIQPGVYFALDAPFVTIIGLYSNVLEDPGVISGQNGKFPTLGNEQLDFLTAQLQRVKNSGNAVLVAVHHPPYSGGSVHGGSPDMLADLDSCCGKAGFWPHAFLSGHAHNYQRFTRNPPNTKYDIPYIVAGNSGHGLSAIKSTTAGPLRTPVKISDELLFENYDDKNYGYLRIIVDAHQIRIEYHDANPAQKSYSDAVTVDLKTHTMISN